MMVIYLVSYKKMLFEDTFADVLIELFLEKYPSYKGCVKKSDLWFNHKFQDFVEESYRKYVGD